MANVFQYGAHPEDSNLSLNRQILLTSHWISAGILYYITILKHTSQYTDDPYVFTISFFGQSKGSLARLCILSVTSQEIYFNIVTHCGVDFESHHLAALFLLSYMHRPSPMLGGIEPHLSAFYLKLPRVLGVMTSENDNG
jgi:hypothetical protein